MNKKAILAKAIIRKSFHAFSGEAFHYLNPNRPFHDNWHLAAIARMAEKAMTGEVRRLIVSLPPRHLKSTIATVALPAFILGHDPTARILCVHYGDELAIQLSGNTRTIMDAPLYREIFPGTNIGKGKQTEDKINTTQGGYRNARPLFGPMTGLGGNFIICDDPSKALDVHSTAMRDKVWTAFVESVMSRLDDPAKDVVLVVAQRLHEDDLIGRLKDLGGWTELVIPAETDIDREYDIGQPKPYVFKAGTVLDPARMSKANLATRRKELGASAYAAQYLQNPTAAGGTVFEWSAFKTYSAAIATALKFDFVFHSWDVASSLSESASYSVCTRWGVVGDKDFHLIGATRERLTPSELVKKASYLYDTDQPDVVLVETAGIGIGLCDTLASKYGRRIQGIRVDAGKVVRAEIASIFIEQGHVWVPAEAPWLEVFRNEIIAFPNAKHDDQVDSMTQMLDSAEKAIKYAIKIGRRRQTEFKIDATKYYPQVSIRLLGAPRRLVSF